VESPVTSYPGAKFPKKPERISAAEWVKQSKKKPGKYKAKAAGCTRAHMHRSQLEAAVCDLLLAQEQKGEVRLLGCEKVIYLSKARIIFIVDFWLLNLRTNLEFYSEAKGFETLRWPTIKKLWRAYGPGVLKIFKGTSTKVFLDEEIIPTEGAPNET